MRKKLLLFISLLAFIASTPTFGQLSYISSLLMPNVIKSSDNASFRFAYLGDCDSLFAYRAAPLGYHNKAKEICINPAASYIASVDEKMRYYFWRYNKAEDFTVSIKPTSDERRAKVSHSSMCFSPDARFFATSQSDGKIKIYSTKDINSKARKVLPTAFFDAGAAVENLAISPNLYFIVGIVNNKLMVWNFETHKVVKEILFSSEVTGCAFSSDGSQIAITEKDGKIVIYDSRVWELLQVIEVEDAELKAPFFNHDNKYLSFVKNDISVEIINLKNLKLVISIEEPTEVLSARFVENSSMQKLFLCVVHRRGFEFFDANGLDPLYGKILKSEVDNLMNEWSQMAEGESFEDFKIRTSEENRTAQMQLFSQEVATNLAGDRLSMANPFVGDYDAQTGMLGVSLGDELGTIELGMSKNDASELAEGKMSFSNAVFTLNDSDEFELVYVEVLNETTGKTYIYDNIGRTTMVAMESEMDFVPIELIEQVKQEEVVLESIKEEVVNRNKEDKLLTDKTEINVKTEVVPDVNADGEKILNYKISYDYKVEKEYSTTEDFPSGGYIIEKSPAAMAMVGIIKQAFDNDFAKYLQEGKRVKVTITGSADASPIRGKLYYSGAYGEFEDEPYYSNKELNSLTLTKKSGITTNDHLAFVRGQGLRDAIEKQIPSLASTRTQFQINVEVSDKVGAEHRRISVEFVVVDAFEQ